MMRMLRALSELSILGIETTVDYLRAIIETDAFRAGETDTGFIERHMLNGESTGADGGVPDEALIAAALALASQKPAGGVGRRRELSPWDTLGSWRVGRRRT